MVLSNLKIIDIRVQIPYFVGIASVIKGKNKKVRIDRDDRDYRSDRDDKDDRDDRDDRDNRNDTND